MNMLYNVKCIYINSLALFIAVSSSLLGNLFVFFTNPYKITNTFGLQKQKISRISLVVFILNSYNAGFWYIFLTKGVATSCNPNSDN